MHCFLFDLDGTLVLTGGAGIRAFDRAFEEIFKRKGSIKVIVPAGRTDTAIFQLMCEHYLDRAPTESEVETMFERYMVLLQEEIDNTLPDDFQIMPGILPLLDFLKEDENCLLGLGTGNIKQGAKIKLTRPDLWKYFDFGGFGSDAHIRWELLQAAVDRGKALLRQGEKIEKVYVIGDTPNDIDAGKAIKAVTVGVATGPYSVEDLKNAGADLVYEDLSNYREFLREAGVL